jgi:hypothetical protein
VCGGFAAIFCFQLFSLLGIVRSWAHIVPKRSAAEVHAMSLANLHGEYATVISSWQAEHAV